MIFPTPSWGINTGQRGSIHMHSCHVSKCIWNGYTASLHDGIVITRPWWLCHSIGYVCALSLKYLADVSMAALIFVIFHVLHYLSSCSLVFVFSWYLDILIFQSVLISNLAYIWVSFSSEPNTPHSDFLTELSMFIKWKKLAYLKYLYQEVVYLKFLSLCVACPGDKNQFFTSTKQ